jgi:hypothetical protein
MPPRSAPPTSEPVSFTQLREALRVEELRDGAIERAERTVRVAPAPVVSEIF